MSIPFPFLKFAPELTPLFLKPYSNGTACYIKSNPKTITFNGGLVAQTIKYQYGDAAWLFDGVDDYLSIDPSTAEEDDLSFDEVAVDKAILRQFNVLVPAGTVLAGVIGIYQWYLDTTHYEQLYYDTASDRFIYTSRDGAIGTLLLATSAAGIVVPLTGFASYFIQIAISNIAGGSDNELTVYVNNTAGTNTSFTGAQRKFAGANLEFGRITDPADGTTQRWCKFILDGVCFRKGLLFARTYTSQPTSFVLPEDFHNNGWFEDNGDHTTGIGSNLVTPNVLPGNRSVEGNDEPYFVSVADHCYFAGGGVRPLRTTLIKPLAPTLGITSTGFTGDFEYAFSYYNSFTGFESSLSPVTAINLTNDAVTITIQHIDSTLTRKYADKVRVYRKEIGVDADFKYRYTALSTAAILAINDTTSNNNNGHVYVPDDLYVTEPCGVNKPPQHTVVSGPSSGVSAGTRGWVATKYNKLLQLESGPNNEITFTNGANDSMNIGFSVAAVAPEVYRIYRRQISNSEQFWYFVLEGSAATIEDNTADSAVPGTFRIDDLTIDVPPNASVVEYHNGRMWYANSKEFPSRLWFSEVDKLDQVRANSYINVGKDLSAPIIGLKSHLGNLVVIKEKYVDIVTGVQPSELRWLSISGNGGASSAQTIKLIENVLFMANGEGVYIFDGTRLHCISDEIEELFSDLVFQQRGMLTAGVDDILGVYVLGVRDNPILSADAVPAFNLADPRIVTSFNNDTLLVFNYKDYFGEDREMKWTKWGMEFISLTEGIVTETGRRNIIALQRVKNLGASTDFNYDQFKTRVSFLDDYIDRGNVVQNEYSWSWIGNPVSFDPRRLNRIHDLTWHFDPQYITSVSMKASFVASGVTIEQAFTLTNQESYQVDVDQRAKEINPKIESISCKERVVVVGYDVAVEPLEYR